MTPEQLREALAAYAHEARAQWMRHQFSRCIKTPKGTCVIAKKDVERWIRQMNTSYAELPEPEKSSDLAEADKILAILRGTSDLPFTSSQIENLIKQLLKDQKP